MTLLIVAGFVVGIYVLVLLISFISIPKRIMDFGDRVRLTLKAYGITMVVSLAVFGLIFLIQALTGETL